MITFTSQMCFHLKLLNRDADGVLGVAFSSPLRTQNVRTRGAQSVAGPIIFSETPQVGPKKKGRGGGRGRVASSNNLRRAAPFSYLFEKIQPSLMKQNSHCTNNMGIQIRLSMVVNLNS